MNPIQKQPVEPDTPRDDDAIEREALEGERQHDGAHRHRKSVEDFVEDGEAERSAKG